MSNKDTEDDELERLFKPYKPTVKGRVLGYVFWKYVGWRDRFYRRFIYKPDFMSCDRCGKPHEIYTKGQAWGLCSSVDFEAGKLRGHYGSEHDLSEFDIIDATQIPGQDICDACIDELVERGALKHAGEYHLCG